MDFKESVQSSFIYGFAVVFLIITTMTIEIWIVGNFFADLKWKETYIWTGVLVATYYFNCFIGDIARKLHGYYKHRKL